MSNVQPAAAVDRDACIGSGNCLDIAPDAFKFDAEDKAYFDPAADTDRNTLIDAQQACPAGAIDLIEQAG
jgi:ferredoxin